jgi:hypothetical protein
MEIMRYLTREPVSPEDIKLARTRILRSVTPLSIQETSGEELGTREGFSKGTKTKEDFSTLEEFKRYAITERAKNEGYELPDFEKYPHRGYPKSKYDEYNLSTRVVLKINEGKSPFLKTGNPLTIEQQNKIKEVFPEADFSKGRYGFSYDDKKNYQDVYDFVVRKNFQPSLTPYYLQEGKIKKPLSKFVQDKIKKVFGSEHKGEFNFNIYQYGVSSGHKGDRNLAARIAAYVNQPIGQERTEKNLGFNLRKPENKLLNYFNVARRDFGKTEYVPIFKQGIILGFQDLTKEGGGKKYYHANYNKDLLGEDEKIITEHPQNEKIQKYLKEQSSFKYKSLDPVVEKVFTERGYKAPTVDKLLRYFISKGRSVSDYNPLVLAHNKQIENDIVDLSILDYAKNLEESRVRKQIEKTKDPFEKKLLIQAADEDFKKQGIRSFIDGIEIGAPQIDPSKQVSDYNKYVNRRIFQHVIGFKDENGNLRNLDTMMKDIEEIEEARKQSKSKPVEKKLTFSEEMYRDIVYPNTKEGREEAEMFRKHKEQYGPDILKSGSGVRTALKMVPGLGQASTAAFIPYDFATALLGGYSLPEATAFAGLNVLPSVVQKAIPALMPGVEQAMSGQEDKIKLANERREALEQGITNIRKKLTNFTNEPDTSTFETAMPMKKGGRVKLANGTDESYTPEIPSLGETDPIGILEQRLMNSNDINEIMRLLEVIKLAKEEKAAKEKEREEYKATQKAKGIRYKEDFPSEAAYFAETGKQLLTNPKYFLSKGAKGIVEGTEFLIGQPLQTLFSQTGKNFEFYEPVLGEKLGINKYIEKNIPKGATTGTLLAGDVAEIAGSILDPFLAYGIIKGALNTSKTKAPIKMEEKIDPTRRDILKTGAILTGGAIVYPTAKKLGLLDTSITATKTANAVRIATNPVVDNMPEFFPYLSEFSRRKGKIVGKDYIRDGMTEFKREITIPLEFNTIGGGKTNVKFEFVHNPAEGNVTAYYTNPLTDEKHMFDFYTGKQGRQAYGSDPKIPRATELYTVEVEPPGFFYKSPDKSDPYRKSYEYYDTATEGDEVIQALDKWYKGLSKEEKIKFESKFITHSEYIDEIPAASYENLDENYPIMDYMYPKKKND